MDKSESELLEEWDLVSVHDAEQENGITEEKIKTNEEIDEKIETNDEIDEKIETNDEIDEKIETKDEIETTDEIDNKFVTSVQNSDTSRMDEGDCVTTIIDHGLKVVAVTVSDMVDSVTKQTDTDVISEQISSVDAVMDEITDVSDAQPIFSANVTEESNSPDFEMHIEENIEDRCVNTFDIKIEENILADTPNTVDQYIEKSHSDIDETNVKTSEKNYYIDEKIKIEPIYDFNSDDHIVNSSLDSSIEHIQIEHCKGSTVQDVPEPVSYFVDEQENAAIESSSSDIDIIDETMEESITSSFLHPLSLSISSSAKTRKVHQQSSEESNHSDFDEVQPYKRRQFPLSVEEYEKICQEPGFIEFDDIEQEGPGFRRIDRRNPLDNDTSSILTPPPAADKKEIHTERTEDIRISQKADSHTEISPSSESSEFYAKNSDSFREMSSSNFQKSQYEERGERERENSQPNPQRPHQRNAARDIFAGILAYLRNMTTFEWSILGGVVLCLYVTVVFNQTNIFAVVEKENVVSQMKRMIDELKLDNKILKDQMLSEMKNEKVFSSFEHQIKELKKENSKLNHMLYDVAKVLEEQKVTQKRFEKRESEYTAPFKKEIDKLKEYINLLKYDNEDLQKQLVRMRYSSYSQGGKDTTDDRAKEQKDEIKADETGSTGDIPLDINALKKWNELISLLSKELGLSESIPLTSEKPHTEKKNINWYWNSFFREFKGTFKDLKANVTSVISDYNKTNKETVSKIYKFVKDFFTVEEEKNQKFSAPGEDSSQWKNIGDFVNDLKEKWTNIKDRLYTSDLKKFLKKFKKSGNADTPHDIYNTGQTTNAEYNEQKPVNSHFESGRRHDKMDSNSEDSKWMFKRAELRAELRDTENEDPSVNWFLKKKKPTSEDDAEKVK